MLCPQGFSECTAGKTAQKLNEANTEVSLASARVAKANKEAVDAQVHNSAFWYACYDVQWSRQKRRQEGKSTPVLKLT